MNYEILSEKNIDLMQNFIDDENTKYEKDSLINFINNENAYGFIARDENKIVGFAYGYTLLRPDGKQDFYLHAIDIMAEFQGNGYGTGLMNYIKEYVKEIG